jgi:hypothetical protein
MVSRASMPKEVANNAMAKFAVDMEVFNSFSFFEPGGACQVCRSVMATVRKDAQKAKLSARQCDEAVLAAQPLFIEWLKKYLQNGKGVIV